MSHMIFASILSADFARLGDDINAALAAGADGVHFDVMDNHFVPNLTIGADICRSLRKFGITCPIDVHLMTSPVNNLVDMFVDAGASAITVHAEADIDVAAAITKIKDNGCSAGFALNPQTPVAAVEPYIAALDLVLVMSVNPGFGGQKFMPLVYDKISELRSLVDNINPNCAINVDGGVGVTNIAKLAQAGADNFVVGSALFSAEDYAQQLKLLRAELA